MNRNQDLIDELNESPERVDKKAEQLWALALAVLAFAAAVVFGSAIWQTAEGAMIYSLF